MDKEPSDKTRGERRADHEKTPGSGVIFSIVVLALILAIGFFYLTRH
ncbi:hypothetical protein J3E64_000436 [Sphingobium sp. OAS761]|nr:hypothetical protein [Sphingobium sp. OAS761]MCP1468769.1 hypothetical protein [Sphingobium sp. OAS761]